MPQYLVGIDIGTSSAKCTLIDQEGRLLAAHGQEYAIEAPQPGWAEQSPQEWLDAASLCLRAVVQAARINPAEIAAIGLTGQMHSLVCLDDAGQPVRPAILWADRRTAAEARWLLDQVGVAEFGRLTGNPPAAGMMLASWLWLQKHEPDTVRRTRRLLLPKDAVRFALTGQYGTEPSDASSTLLFDPHTRRWSEPILQLAGLAEDRLPQVHESAEVAGYLNKNVAAACGLRAGIPIVYGCSDQAAQAFGQGIVQPGQVSCTIGTGGQLFAPIDRPVHDPQLRLHLFCHALPEVWHLETAILSAGLALRWLRDRFWPSSSYQSLADLASGVQAAEVGLFYLPYLAGERTPHMDADVRAAWVGLDLQHGQAEVVRAVMEGVVFALKQGLDLLETLGVPPGPVIAAGGSTRHPLWLQLQADIFNRPVHPAQSAETTGIGAALLAGIGVGVFADAAQAVEAAVRPVGAAIYPDEQKTASYQQAYQRYLQLYPALKQAGFAGI